MISLSVISGHEFMRRSISNLVGGINFIRKAKIEVGIPAETDAAHAGGTMNSELLYLHCNGSPANNIPPRNVLKAGLGEDGAQKEMKKLIRSEQGRSMKKPGWPEPLRCRHNSERFRRRTLRQRLPGKAVPQP